MGEFCTVCKHHHCPCPAAASSPWVYRATFYGTWGPDWAYINALPSPA